MRVLYSNDAAELTMTASFETKVDETEKEVRNGIDVGTENTDPGRQETFEEDTPVSEVKQSLLNNHHESQEDDDTNFIDSAIEMDVMTPESEVMIQLQKSQSDEWFPDGGFGWAVVIGGVIIHIFIGIIFIYFFFINKFYSISLWLIWGIWHSLSFPF